MGAITEPTSAEESSTGEEGTLSDVDSEEAAATSDSDLDPATKDIPLGQRGWTLETSSKSGGKMPFGKLKVNKRRRAHDEKADGRAKRRENKNRPVEMSSKRPVPRLRQVLDVPSKKKTDPRFTDTAGALNEDVFKNRYSFIFDESLPQEKEETAKAVKKAKSAGRRQELRGQLTRIQQQISLAKDEKRRKAAEAEAKAKEKEAVKQGKKPFFLKRSEKKRQELILRFQELKASGRLQKVMAKKRKKNAAKDHRYIPAQRRT